VNEARPLNKPLIVLTVVVAVILGSSGLTAPHYYSKRTALIITLGTIVLSPIFIAWTRALWNTVVPRVTGWRDITFWEAAGLTALAAFLSQG
jgi:hypothetical protein